MRETLDVGVLRIRWVVMIFTEKNTIRLHADEAHMYNKCPGVWDKWPLS